MTEIDSLLFEARDLVEQKKYEPASKLINKALDLEPDNSFALYLFGYVALEEERYGLARVTLHRCLELNRDKSEIWNTYGRTFQEGHDLKQAEAAFQRAMTLKPKDPLPYVNLGLNYIVQGNPKRALQVLHKALSLAPELPEALYNKGLARLMLKDWGGWEDYEVFLGRSPDRRERIYCNPFEPRWDGSKGKTVVAYGEQGLGDEVTFASCLPDLIKDSKKVIIECDRRLKNLFQRSFPEADVYGTRFSPEVDWVSNYQIDSRVAFGSLPKFYRNSKEQFPGTPYLIPDPERAVQWKSLLDSISDKPKIGIAWTGGSRVTGKRRRSLKLEQLLPILKQDATFVSLEYHEERSQEVKELEQKHGIKVHHWDRATVSDKYFDYDETAALVSQLDMVIGVTTASLHLAGALGIKTWALVPEWPTWLWGIEGDDIPWCKSIKLHRQKGTWDSLIARVSRDFTNIRWDGSKAAGSLQRPTAVDTSKRIKAG